MLSAPISPAADSPDPWVTAPASVSISRAYRKFTFGAGMWFGGWGMLQVLFSWLVVGGLQAREELVGLAQLALFCLSTDVWTHE